MENKKKIKKLKTEDYQRLFGMKKETFGKMLDILEKAYTEKHKKDGKPPKLTVFDKLIITLQYYRDTSIVISNVSVFFLHTIEIKEKCLFFVLH